MTNSFLVDMEHIPRLLTVLTIQFRTGHAKTVRHTAIFKILKSFQILKEIFLGMSFTILILRKLYWHGEELLILKTKSTISNMLKFHILVKDARSISDFIKVTELWLMMLIALCSNFSVNIRMQRSRLQDTVLALHCQLFQQFK